MAELADQLLDLESVVKQPLSIAIAAAATVVLAVPVFGLNRSDTSFDDITPQPSAPTPASSDSTGSAPSSSTPSNSTPSNSTPSSSTPSNTAPDNDADDDDDD